MCTLTFIPSKEGFLVGANRDESPLRSSSGLSAFKTKSGSSFLVAKEPVYGGSNIAVSKKRVSVLLNGAFRPHAMGGKYRLSRGLVLLESLEEEHLFQFVDRFNLLGIEPFTLVDFTDKIRVLRWDGVKSHRESFDMDKPRIWASAQLYSVSAIENRGRWFSQFTAKENIDFEDLREFHFTAGEGDPFNDLVMNRENMVRTVSITIFDSESAKAGHWNLIEEKQVSFLL